MATIQFEVPEHYSAVGILDSNPVIDCDIFQDDGYVINRKTGKKRKWFLGRPEWKHFWEPVLKEPARIERAYFCIEQRIVTVHKKLDALDAEIRVRGWKRNGILVAYAEAPCGRNIMYLFENYQGYFGSSREFLPDGEVLVPDELGQKRESILTYLDSLYRRQRMIGGILQDSLRRLAVETASKNKRDTGYFLVDVKVNNRVLTFRGYWREGTPRQVEPISSLDAERLVVEAL